MSNVRGHACDELMASAAIRVKCQTFDKSTGASVWFPWISGEQRLFVLNSSLMHAAASVTFTLTRLIQEPHGAFKRLC